MGHISRVRESTFDRNSHASMEHIRSGQNQTSLGCEATSTAKGVLALAWTALHGSKIVNPMKLNELDIATSLYSINEQVED